MRHIHPNCDEVLIEGTLTHSVGQESVAMAAGDAIFIPRNSPHDAIPAL
ncbi:cupin domain-containing protein [Mesorhizobium sp. M0601]